MRGLAGGCHAGVRGLARGCHVGVRGLARGCHDGVRGLARGCHVASSSDSINLGGTRATSMDLSRLLDHTPGL